MKSNFKKLFLTGCVTALLAIQSCTNLDENVYDQIPQDQFGLNQEQLDALVGPLYGGLGDYYGNFASLNNATDEQLIPTRGGDWKDGDGPKRVHQHTWDPVLDGDFNGLWTWIYGNVASINQQLASVKDDRTIAELRTLRAFYHYLAMDNFGNVIIADKVGAGSPAQKTRAEIYAWVESELLASLPNLSDAVGGSNYGRMNKFVGNMILAKLYLNAQVYTGTPQWQKALDQSDIIIKSGKFQLSGDFFSNFSATNQNSGETILATPMDKTKRGGMNFHMRTLHYKSQLTYKIGNAPWNGYCTVADFYNSYDDKDVRKKGWLVGQQFSADGSPLDDDGVPLAFTVNVPAFEMPAGASPGRISGVRFNKYEIQKNNPNADQDNDFVVYRLGDVYLMRGEAKFRLGDVAGGIADINVIRKRAGVPDFTAAITLDDILAERGRELAWEFHRRQDLIRFGQFGKAWLFKPVSAKTRELYPIPQNQISLNPNLKQNPGY